MIPAFHSVTALETASGSARLVAVGYNVQDALALVFTSDDMGINWTRQSTSSIGDVNLADVTAVNIMGKFYLVAVADAGQLFTSEDGGETWTAQNSGTGNALRGVAAFESAAGISLIAVGIQAPSSLATMTV